MGVLDKNNNEDEREGGIVIQEAYRPNYSFLNKSIKQRECSLILHEEKILFFKETDENVSLFNEWNIFSSASRPTAFLASGKVTNTRGVVRRS